jgi:PST family polysaccharide transporter
VIKNFNLNFKFPSKEVILHQLNEGWNIFASNIFITLFNGTNVIILGLLCNNTYVGYYVAAEKLILVFITLQIPMVNSIFPYFSKEFSENTKNALNKLYKIRNAGILMYLFLFIFSFIFSETIINLVYGKNMIQSALVFKILSIIPLFIFINNIYGNQILVNLSKTNLFLKSFILTGISNIIMVFPLTYYLKDVGVAISRTISEFILAYLMWYYAKKSIKEYI